MSPSLASHQIQNQLHHHQQPTHEIQQYAIQHQRAHILQPNEQQFQPVVGSDVNAGAIELDAVEIFVDPAMGTPLSIYVDREIVNYEVLCTLIKRHGGIVASGYSTVQYILVDRQRQSGQSLYRQYHSKKGKVVLDGQWVVACVAAQEMLMFKKEWGGFKVTGSEITQAEPPQQPPPPQPLSAAPAPAPPSAAETEASNASGPSKKVKVKRKTRGAARKDTQPLPSEMSAEAGASTVPTPAAESLQAHLTEHPPAPFAFPAHGSYTLPHPPQPGFSPWAHLPSPQYASPVIGAALHSHHEQQQQQHNQQQARPHPTPPQEQLLQQVHHQPHHQQQHQHQQHQPQPQPQAQPGQVHHPQLTHLSQVHYRLPPQPQPQQQQQHPMHPFAAGPATTPAAALAAARGHWYGVSPAAGMPPPSPLPAAPSQLSGPPAPNQASRPSHINTSQQAQQPQPPHVVLTPPPPAPPVYQQTFNPSGWTQPTYADGVYYSHHLGNPFPDSQYVVGASNPAPAPSAIPVVPSPALPRQAPSGTAQEGDAEEHATVDAGDTERRNRKRKRTSEATPSKPKSKYVAPILTDLTTLVPALAPPRPSPKAPTRVLKSTYGGNLFTVEDVEYMKKYIDWCVDMGLVLSLREICERLAVKAPHHTFYSWRRYCNKHKIKLGCYQMAPADVDVDGTNNDDNDPSMDLDEEGMEQQPDAGPQSSQDQQRLPSVQQIMGVGNSASHSRVQQSPRHPSAQHLHQPQPMPPPQPNQAVVLQEASSSDDRHRPHLHVPQAAAGHHHHHGGRDRSPTPPRTLHRSTTGKGIAYSDEDVTFLVKYLNYRRAKDSSLNMQLFWNDVATKAPHHSRASWLKYWRRHRHEMEVEDGGDGFDGAGPSGSGSGGGNGNGNGNGGVVVAMQLPGSNPGGVPVHPRRSRYSHEDDVLLAKFWATDPQGTSDKLFQDFARTHSHHPWKGWQEHHRLHKTQIDHLVRLRKDGVDVDTIPGPPVEEPPPPKARGKGAGKGRKRKEKEVETETE